MKPIGISRLIAVGWLWWAATLQAQMENRTRATKAMVPRVDVCELAKNPQSYAAKRLVIRGVFLRYQHATYLVAYPKCQDNVEQVIKLEPTPEVISALQSIRATRNDWVLGTMDGTLSDGQTRPWALLVTSISEMQKVPPRGVYWPNTRR